MKKCFILLTMSSLIVVKSFAQSPIDTVSGYITSNTTWTKSNVYFMKGFIYVINGATLTIEPGTLIKGDKASKGSLVVTRGCKVIADGTPGEPIVFTSNGPQSFRTYGDWGGVVLLGKATINQPGGEALIEGGIEDGLGNGTYGGGATPDDNDNSGIIRYVRIEFPGIAFQPNSEINGLTCGGVGRGTILDHIQVSYSGDDSYEFFGGTVNAKHLIAFRGLDDDFDTDNGFGGKLQFLYGLRDPNIADVSGSNGFESDNDATGSADIPITKATFSNVTIAGPRVTATTSINGSFKRAAHLRRNTQQDIYNTILMAYPTGLMIDGPAAEANALADQLQVRNTIIAGCTANFEVVAGSTFDISTWFGTPAYNNATYANNTDLMLTDPFNLAGPNAMPLIGSPALTGADFTNTNLTDPFFEAVSYRGAFGDSDWTSGWTNWTPGNTAYTAVHDPKSISEINLYPNPMTTQATLNLNLLKGNHVNIEITDLAGRVLSEVLDENMGAGSHTFNINTHLASGLYLLLIKTGDENQMIKLTIAK
ncbi:MAG: T9SS type A sorting domain-containing protein [Chitinophagales bacterium]|nr:T9SS type A sorting domain-containing protein [Chitinophagales bacterium]